MQLRKTIFSFLLALYCSALPTAALAATAQKLCISDDAEYRQFCYSAATDDKVFSTFKRNPIYCKFVEHVTYDEGKAYLEYVQAKYPSLLDAWEAFSRNDQVGSPITYTYPKLGSASPNTLRYIKISAEVGELFGDLTDKKILEIGVGYGGQCKTISDSYAFAEYVLLDMPEPLALTARYLATQNVSNLRFIASEDAVAEEFDIVISNFAFSECNRDVQDAYLEKYILKSKAGYMLLNNMSKLLFPAPYFVLELRNVLTKNGYRVKILPEIPSTGPQNILIIWYTP